MRTSIVATSRSAACWPPARWACRSSSRRSRARPWPCCSTAWSRRSGSRASTSCATRPRPTAGSAREHLQLRRQQAVRAGQGHDRPQGRRHPDHPDRFQGGDPGDPGGQRGRHPDGPLQPPAGRERRLFGGDPGRQPQDRRRDRPVHGRRGQEGRQEAPGRDHDRRSRRRERDPAPRRLLRRGRQEQGSWSRSWRASRPSGMPTRRSPA